MAKSEKPKKQKKQRTTVQKLSYWNGWHKGLTGMKIGTPAIPFAVSLGINWNEWVGGNASKGWSIGIGFGMLVVGTFAAMYGVWKKDELAEQKVSPVFYIATIFLIIGFSFMLLASIMNEMGVMLLYVSTGVFASATEDQVDKTLVRPRMAFYKELVKTNGLDKQSSREIEDRAQAAREGAEARKDDVDLL